MLQIPSNFGMSFFANSDAGTFRNIHFRILQGEGGIGTSGW